MAASVPGRAIIVELRSTLYYLCPPQLAPAGIFHARGRSPLEALASSRRRSSPWSTPPAASAANCLHTASPDRLRG